MTTPDAITRLKTAIGTVQAAYFRGDQVIAWSAVSAAIEAVEGDQDRIYIAIIDVCGFLRGYGDAAEVAANRLIKLVPESFDDRKEDARQALQETDR